MIWYVAYGSNLLSERFAVYLQGGTIHGAGPAHPGARDNALWQEVCSVTLPYQLFFAGHSRRWPPGGSAFVDPTVRGAVALACAYLITGQQFQDVLAQESGRPVGTEVALGPALASGASTLGDGRYDMVLCPGEHRGYSMLTFTTPRKRAELDVNAPSRAYASTISLGLQETHGLSPSQADSHIANAHRSLP